MRGVSSGVGDATAEARRVPLLEWRVTRENLQICDAMRVVEGTRAVGGGGTTFAWDWRD
jgi:hypothetical protein